MALVDMEPNTPARNRFGASGRNVPAAYSTAGNGTKCQRWTMRQSQLELLLAAQIEQAGIQKPEQEWIFHPSRKWRFDFAFPHLIPPLAIEVHGGTWSRGRHTRGKGFEGDCDKNNAAVLLGWRVLQFTGDMVRDGRAIDMIVEALKVW